MEKRKQNVKNSVKLFYFFFSTRCIELVRDVVFEMRYKEMGYMTFACLGKAWCFFSATKTMSFISVFMLTE